MNAERTARLGDARAGRADGYEVDELRAGVDLHVGADVDLPDATGERRGNRTLHLHALDRHQSVVRRHQVARLHVDGNDDTGHAGTNDSSIAPREAMGHTVDLHEVVAALDGRHDPHGATADVDPAPVTPQTGDHEADLHAIDGDPVLTPTRAAHIRGVLVPAVAQVEPTAELGADLWPPAPRGCEQLVPTVALPFVVRVDGRHQHCNITVLAPHGLAGSC